jgi:hypothetical protein
MDLEFRYRPEMANDLGQSEVSAPGCAGIVRRSANFVLYGLKAVVPGIAG